MPNKFIKSQVVGPITFLASVRGENGQALIHDSVLSDAIICGMGLLKKEVSNHILELTRDLALKIRDSSIL